MPTMQPTITWTELLTADEQALVDHYLSLPDDDFAHQVPLVQLVGKLIDLLELSEDQRQLTQRNFAELLLSIKQHDLDYDVRNRLVIHALGFADLLGYLSGIRIDPAEPEWPVAYIELPQGQITYHLSQHPLPWDGHSTATKFERIEAYVAHVREADHAHA